LALVDREWGAVGVGDHGEARGGGTGGRHERAPARLPGVARGVGGIADREVREPVRWDAPLLPGLGADAPVAAAGVDYRGEAAVAGLVLPAEQLAEERLRPPGVGGDQLIPAQGANIIDQRGADPRARLP